MDMHGLFELSSTDGRPMYLQIMEQIKDRIAVGEWPAGHPLPSIRKLAVGLRVSVITVKRAYLELEHAGVILTQQGKGSRVSNQPGLSAALRMRELDGHLNKAAQLGALLDLDARSLATRLQAALLRLDEGQA